MTTIFDKYRRGMAVLGEESYAEGEGEGEGEEYAEGEGEGEEGEAGYEMPYGESSYGGGYGGGGGGESGDGGGYGGSEPGSSEPEAPAGESSSPGGGSGGGSGGGEGEEGSGGGSSTPTTDPNAADSNQLDQAINDAASASKMAASYISSVIDLTPTAGGRGGSTMMGLDTIIGVSEAQANSVANRAAAAGHKAVALGQKILKKGGKNKSKAQRAISTGNTAIAKAKALHDHVNKAKAKAKGKGGSKGTTKPHSGGLVPHTGITLPGAGHGGGIGKPIKRVASSGGGLLSKLHLTPQIRLTPQKTTTLPSHATLTRKISLPVRKTGLYGSLVARGRERLAEEGSALTSAIPGVSDEAWTKFVRVMRTANAKDISPSNAVGMFEMMPRRLADLGLVENLARKQLASGRVGWVYAFVPPLTAEQYLGSALVQYRVFCESMRDYVRRIDSGEIELPAGMSLSGALAVLHRAGPEGLRSTQQFPSTRALYARAKDIF